MPPLVIDLRRTEDARDVVHRAVQALAEGSCVAFPTETDYVVAASGRRDEAIARLAAIVLAIGSQGTAKSDHTEFLPFLAPLPGGKPNIKPAVIATIEGLIRARRLPMAIVALLAEDIRSTMKPAE